ncbi:DUF1540 domain-containing protein [Clostridium sp. KNHs216]|jgi:Domain of Unknown Function (DUF1540).|uniref:DUF1540 domain-containing protein n=1 Tax=Eubacteriales TaxID=186802 RepID=UPI0005716194|nr:DUF1540 domain-containing protein [Clostridium sp. KNHs216]MBE6830264.1 DUF1540 domain-containing protein [Oscillospiraceae bacterium]TQI68793.1 uncharacterized protein DUF1540 [Clostridium sp. KNHs216]
MTNLHCDVMTCANNRDNFCCRPEIQVSGRQAQDSEETCCSSFLDATDGAQNSVGCSLPNTALDIYCEAENCRFNSNERCDANEISVQSGNAQPHSQSATACASFENR